MYRTVFIYTLVTVLSLYADVASSCLVQGCPIGGKRSMNDAERQCSACGPGYRGVCVGLQTCCGDFGCHMGTDDAKMCLTEQINPEPCHVEGRKCGLNAYAKCVADGICCDFETCTLDEKCQQIGEGHDSWPANNNDAGVGRITAFLRSLRADQ